MKTETIETKVDKVDVDLDALFDGSASADSVTVSSPEDRKPNIFSKPEPVSLDFADPDYEEKEENPDNNSDDNPDNEKDNKTKAKTPADDPNTILESFDADVDDEGEEKKETRGRKRIEGIADVFSKMIESEKIIPFDDGKPLEEYSAKDWEELIEANLEERANQIRKETPKQFFESLPQELQIAAKYVADGGKDLKGLFSTLAQTEEKKTLDISDERDQELIIRDYLQATGYGTIEEINEEIELWKDLGKLEQQASKFKPKLDKMQEEIVATKLKEQEMRKKQQQQAAEQHMENVYNVLKDGTLGDIKLDKKTQNLLYNGLVQPNYPSVSGRNTNLLGHLLEKYQFVEPNYNIIAEALWLLSDPDSYKSKIMEKGSQKAVENTVRKLKIEESNKSNSSLGVNNAEEQTGKVKPKIQRPQNIFKRF